MDFDGYTETVLSGGTTTTTKYYSANGTRIALRIGGATLDSLLSDPLGSNSVALNNTGQVIGLEHYSPYGTVDYQWGSMPTAFNYAGERLDSQTGLLYDTFRSYDPLSGRFVRADNVQDNSTGMDPYAYVGDNPETRNDPSGHCWPWCTAILGAVVGAVVGGVVSVVQQASSGKPIDWGHVMVNAGAGAVAGALVGTGVGAMAGMAGATGALASIGTASAIGAGAGVVTSAIGAVASHQTFGNALQSVFSGAVIGGVVGGLTAGLGSLAGLGGNALLQGSAGLGRALGQGLIQSVGGFGGNVVGQGWDNWASGSNQPIDWGQALVAGGISFGAGAIGQWVYDHVPIFQTGNSYRGYNRAYRAAMRDANWNRQGIWANSLSGAIQGAVQFIQSIGTYDPSSTSGVPREGHAF